MVVLQVASEGRARTKIATRARERKEKNVRWGRSRERRAERVRDEEVLRDVFVRL